MKKGPTPPRKWQTMAQGVITNREATVARVKQVLGREPTADEMMSPEVWLNDLYVVGVERRENGSVSVLSIRRKDRGWARDWRHFQRIKNDIAGPETEAVELYPAESRLMDTANQFWLWCAEPGETFSIGFDSATTVASSDDAAQFGAKQRDLEEDS